MPNTTTAPTNLLFESESCGRCGGSGKHSYNTRDGSVCFGCSGKGVRLSKRGAVAQAFYESRLTVTYGDLKVGDRLRTVAMTFGGGSYLYAAEVVAISDLHEYGQSLQNGTWVPSMGIVISLKNVKSGSVANLTASPKHSARKLWDALTIESVKAAALAYQSTLTKTGTVKKGKVAACTTNT